MRGAEGADDDGGDADCWCSLDCSGDICGFWAWVEVEVEVSSSDARELGGGVMRGLCRVDVRW